MGTENHYCILCGVNPQAKHNVFCEPCIEGPDKTAEQPKQLWEILVPTVSNAGKPFRTRYHRVWDAKVRAITGGLTIMPVAKGQWVHGSDLFVERMIPVRIACTREQIEQIIDLTAQYYDQIAVMAHKVSDEVIIKYAKSKVS